MSERVFMPDCTCFLVPELTEPGSGLEFCLLGGSFGMTLPHPAFQRLVKVAQAEREQKYGQGPDHRLHWKVKLVCNPLHIPDQYLMDQKTIRGELGQPQKGLCGKQPGNKPLAHGKQPDQ